MTNEKIVQLPPPLAVCLNKKSFFPEFLLPFFVFYFELFFLEIGTYPSNEQYGLFYYLFFQLMLKYVCAEAQLCRLIMEKTKKG